MLTNAQKQATSGKEKEAADKNRAQLPHIYRGWPEPLSSSGHHCGGAGFHRWPQRYLREATTGGHSNISA